jgi:hypothetical protein
MRLLNEDVHCDGTRSRRVATAEPGGTASSTGHHQLGVACPSTASLWAVGASCLKARGHQWPDQILY